MAAPKKNSSVIVIRRRDSIALPPCTLGFASLVEPDEYEEGKPLFKLDACFTPAAIQALGPLIEKECYGDPTNDRSNLARLREEMAGNKDLKDLVTAEPQPAAEWAGQKLKQPKETAKVQLPKMVVACKAKFKDRKGEIQTRTIGCWDGHNNPLELKSLKLGMGSIIQAVVNPNIFFSKLIGRPQPKLDLVGVRVLKLVRWGGQRPPQETDEDAIREVLGEEFQMDEDLSAFASGGLPGEDPATPEPPSPDGVVGGAF